MSLFPSNSQLGKLKIIEVYDYYDGPKFFCAKNQFKQLMVVYWVEHNKDDKSFGWLYLPITEEKLNDLRRGKISVRDAYENPEEGLYLVYTFPNSSMDSAKYLKKYEVPKNFLPPKKLKISPEDIDVIDNKEENWVYELHIKKPNSHDFPSATAVTSALNAFRDIFLVLMTTGPKTHPKIFPISAVPSSFKLKLGTNDNKEAINALIKFEKIVTSTNKNLSNLLQESKLDPFILKSIYEVILNNNVDIIITPKTFNQVKSELRISKRNIEDRIATLENNTFNILDSIKVPQANDIDKVIEVLELKKKGKEISHELIGDLNSPRQIQYYTDAAYSLGLLTKDKYLTSAGRFLLSKKDISNRYQILADRFESSDFGWCWMHWAKVTSMIELDPNTASDFIRESVPGLGTATAKRRATTLSKWQKKLAPHHRDYKK